MDDAKDTEGPEVQLREVLRELRELRRAVASWRKRRIVPEAVYTREETAEILTFYGRAKTVREIPEAQLPVTPLGPNDGRIGYRGFDILHYLDSKRRINGKAAPPERSRYGLKEVA